MTSRAVALFRQRIERRASALAPDLRKAILAAYDRLAAAMPPGQLETFIRSGQVERIFSELLTPEAIDTAFAPVARVLRDGVEQAGARVAAELPGLARGAMFDVLSPTIVDAVRALNTKVIQFLGADTREVFRAYVEQGLREGLAPRTIARQLRSLIGLSPSQLEQVQNFRAALSGEAGRTVTDYTLRNRAVDGLLAKGPLTAEQIDRYAGVYTKARIAQNVNVLTTTAALDTQRLAQHLTFQDAIERGDLDGDTQFKRWSQVDRPTKRDSHELMHGEVVKWDETFSNGDLIPGDSDPWNCGCLAIYFTSFDPANARKPGASSLVEGAF